MKIVLDLEIMARGFEDRNKKRILPVAEFVAEKLLPW
jgi:hypothetical protein